MREGYQPARPSPVVRPLGARAPIAQTPTAVMAAEVARFFTDLRGALRLTHAQTAQALATRVDIIAALEMGQVGALPPLSDCSPLIPALNPSFHAGSFVSIIVVFSLSSLWVPAQLYTVDVGHVATV